MQDKFKVFLKGIVLPLVSYIVINFIVGFIMFMIKVLIGLIENYNNSGITYYDKNYLLYSLLESDGFLTNSIIITGISAIIFFLIFYFKNFKNFLSSVNTEEKEFDKNNTKHILMLSFGSSLFFNILLLYDSIFF